MNKSYYAVIPANVRYDEDLSANAKLIYGEITALTNQEGYCWATNAYFADLYKVSIRSVKGWISQLAEKGYIRTEVIFKFGSKEVDQRKIYIVSGPSEEIFTTPRKNLHQPSEKNFTTPSEKNFTDNNKGFNNTINNTSNIKNTPKSAKKKSDSAEFESEFESLWAIYPRKVGKTKALTVYIKARKSKKYTYEEIKNGLYKYIEYAKNNDTDMEYIAHFTTWLNQERWNDVYATAPKKPKNAIQYLKQKYGSENGEFGRNGEIIDYNPSEFRLEEGF